MKIPQRKTFEQIESLNTPRLLRYYRAERQRLFKHQAGCQCECCGEYYWDLRSGYESQKVEYYEHAAYVEFIKSVLDKREHVNK